MDRDNRKENARFVENVYLLSTTEALRNINGFKSPELSQASMPQLRGEPAVALVNFLISILPQEN